MRDRTRPPVAALALMLAASLASGCSTRVSTTSTAVPPPAQAQAPLARPQRVLVEDFAVDPGAVRLDQAIGLRIQRQSSGADPAIEQSKLATEVQAAISETLLKAFHKMDVPVELMPPGSEPTPGDLVVRGQVTRIDQGNRTRRLTVGFGAGKSQVNADAAILYVGMDGQPRVLQTYSGSSNSGRKPGMAASAGMAAQQASMLPVALGAASGANGERNRSGVAGEGQRVAEHLSRSIGEYFARQGWIPASAVPAWSLR